ncbi:hypothetical protein [Spirosoma arcticum]
MIRFPFNTLCLCILPLASLAQTPPPASGALPKAEVRLSYAGSVSYPGAKVGLALPVKQRLRWKPNRQAYVRKDRFAVVNLGFYHHPDFHDNVYLTAEWQRRRTKPTGWFTEFSPGLSFSRTFLGGTTYRVADNGDVSIRKAAGYSYALVTVGGGVGFDFSVKKSRPVTTFLRASLLTMLPYNSFVYVRPTLELGLTYKLPSLTVFAIRSKTSTK